VSLRQACVRNGPGRSQSERYALRKKAGWRSGGGTAAVRVVADSVAEASVLTGDVAGRVGAGGPVFGEPGVP
jgi:hypothetical protein